MVGSCVIFGDPDLYGLGVRIGIYCQWLATSIANIASEEEISAMYTVNMCFQAAILCGVVIATSNMTVSAVEVFITFPLCFGGFAATQIHGPSNSLKTTFFGLFAAYQLFGALAGFSAWFWWVGLDQLSRDSCPDYAFFFTRLEIYHLKWPCRIVACISCLLFLVFEILSLSRIVRAWHGVGFRDMLLSFLESLDAENKAIPLWKFYLSQLALVLCLVFMLLMAELTIAWNNITGDVNRIGTVGQVVPLLVGIAGFLKVILGSLQKMARASSSEDHELF